MSFNFKITATSSRDQWVNYHQTSNTSHTLVGNKIIDHSDVIGASPVGADPTTSSFSTQHLRFQWIGQRQTARRDKKHSVWQFCVSYIRDLTVYLGREVHDVWAVVGGGAEAWNAHCGYFPASWVGGGLQQVGNFLETLAQLWLRTHGGLGCDGWAWWGGRLGDGSAHLNQENKKLKWQQGLC